MSAGNGVNTVGPCSSHQSVSPPSSWLSIPRCSVYQRARPLGSLARKTCRRFRSLVPPALRWSGCWASAGSAGGHSPGHSTRRHSAVQKRTGWTSIRHDLQGTSRGSLPWARVLRRPRPVRNCVAWQVVSFEGPWFEVPALCADGAAHARLIQPPLHRDLEGLEADQGEPWVRPPQHALELGWRSNCLFSVMRPAGGSCGGWGRRHRGGVVGGFPGQAGRGRQRSSRAWPW